jgi:hypothetical protein
MIGQYLGLATLAAGIPGRQSMASTARINQRLGWSARYSWRDFVAL